MQLTLIVNDKTKVLDIEGHETLLKILREKLFLTGTKEGCGKGECGACTVILNGKPVTSCLVIGAQLQDNDRIETIEGLEKDGRIHSIQQAFIDAGAVQCGFCIPGMIMSSKALLDEKANPSRDEIKEHLSGNLCRCTGYQKIFEAVELAAKSYRR